MWPSGSERVGHRVLGDHPCRTCNGGGSAGLPP